MKQNVQNWAKYRSDHFKVNILWSGLIRIPSFLIEEGIVGYFYLSADNSIIHLFDVNKKEYCFKEGFTVESQSFLFPTNNVCYIKKDSKTEPFLFKNQLFFITENYYYLNGWYRQIIMPQQF